MSESAGRGGEALNDAPLLGVAMAITDRRHAIIAALPARKRLANETAQRRQRLVATYGIADHRSAADRALRASRASELTAAGADRAACVGAGGRIVFRDVSDATSSDLRRWRWAALRLLTARRGRRVDRRRAITRGENQRQAE